MKQYNIANFVYYGKTLVRVLTELNEIGNDANIGLRGFTYIKYKKTQ